MRKNRISPEKLRHVAALQALKTKASSAELAEAQGATRLARENLSERDAVLGQAAARVDDVFARDSLDLPSLQVSAAVLESAARAQAAAADELGSREDDEDHRHAIWSRDHRLEREAGRLHARSRKRHAQWREDTAASDAADLKIARAIAGAR